MPAGKPVALHTRHSTKAEIKAALEKEAAVLSDRELPINEPARLGDDPVACATWRRLIREYNRLEAKLVGRLDMDLLIDYCLVMSQIDQLDKMRNAARDLWITLSDRFRELREENQIEEAVELADKVTKAYDGILKLDARVDQKRKMIFTFRQSLFMTPRSRTGVKPEEDQEKKAPIDPMEELLNKGLSDARMKVDNKVDSNGGPGDEA